MVLFLSASFLQRLKFNWKPELKAFLIGDRNLNFFTPDSIVEVQEISSRTIDAFLQKSEMANNWQLLGFLSKNEQLSLPGYIEVVTLGSSNPKDWKAQIRIPSASESDSSPVEIRTPDL